LERCDGDKENEEIGKEIMLTEWTNKGKTGEIREGDRGM
jgi:hypothetical protein